MTRIFKGSPPGVLIEWLMAAIIVAMVIYTAIFLYIHSYLPQPFFYEPNDTYADWFNTAYWARDPGTYDLWTSLYPPLSFVFLRIFTLDSCYLQGRAFDASVGYSARDCDWLGLGTIWVVWLLDVVLIYFTFRKIDRATAIPRTICLGLGWPMLDGLERGNLVLVSFTCLILAFGPLIRSAKLKWLFAGLAVNFKVYLISGIVAQLLKRKWLWLEGALIFTIVIYLITFAILGRGSPAEIYRNIHDWSLISTASPLDLWFATSFSGLISLLEGPDVTMEFVLGSRTLDFLQLVLPALVHLVQAFILIAAASVWLRPEVVPSSRAVNLAIMLALITQESGGYSPVYFVLFVLMEPWRGGGRKVAIFLCYLLAISADISIGDGPTLARDAYFRNTSVIIDTQITIMPFIRPLAILIIASAVAFTTIHDVWRDIRLQGWSARWRYRRDLPLLPWVCPPDRPVVSTPAPGP